MKCSTTIHTGRADGAAADSARQLEKVTFERAESILGPGDDGDQLALSKRLDALCTRLGARNAGDDSELDGTVGDGL